MFSTLLSFVETAVRHIHGVFGRPTGAPAPDEASRPDSLVARRSATESTQSDGGSSDAEADGADGTPRFRGRNNPAVVGGQGGRQGGRPICPAFNSQAGCRNQRCQLEHRCAVCRDRHSASVFS
ncbi:hypothetical protein K523DRAFT_242816 [Schizophyllum commune Tattone D]|nr:hypothetical protein K523DRAFT_242816 [Schizophyllum commune Tattone D]